MGTAALRRWLGAATITGALLLATVPDLASASTQPSTAGTMGLYFDGSALSPGGDRFGGDESVNVYVSAASALTEVDNLTVTMDTSKLPAGANLNITSAFDFQCTTSTGSVVCSATKPMGLYYEVGSDTFAVDAYLFIDLTAAADATYGLGSLTVSATADGLTGASRTVPVGIAEPVKLAAGPNTSFTGPPDSTYAPQWTVTNEGSTTVHRVSLSLGSDLGFNPTKHYSNCQYYLSSAAVCVFDNDLTPGVTYEVSEPTIFQIAADHKAPFHGATTADWLTPLDLSTNTTVGGTPGTDGPLNLVVQSDQAPAPPLTQPDLPQTDHNNLGFTDADVWVSGVNPADLAAIGTSVPAPSWGGSVAVSVGVFNQGPAVASMSRSGDPLTDVTVTLPNGTTATAAPLQCAPYVSGQPDWQQPGKPGFGQYDCAVYQNLAVQQTYPLPFTVHVPPGPEPLQGSVTITDDANPAGNTASIVITPQVLGRITAPPTRPTLPRR